METPDQLVEAATLAARNARRAAALALVAVLVAVVVLMIDQTIKRAIITEAEQARTVLDQFRAEVVKLSGQVQQGRADSGPDRGDPGGVADVAGSPAAADPDAGANGAPARSGRVGSQRRPRGDG